VKRGATILLVEDDRDDLFLFKRALHDRQSLVVQAVSDCSQAIDYLEGRGDYADRETHPFPKFIITDNCKSPLGAPEFLRWLRNHPRCRVIPTVVLSGSGSPSQVDQAFELGAHSYFEKPSNLSELQSLLTLVFDYWEKSLIPADRGVVGGSQ
jgi:two-component system response regulator